MTKAGGIAAEQLRTIVERVERVEQEVKALNQDKSDIYAEGEAAGFDKKALKIVIQRRRLDRAAREEQDSIVELYEHALGMHPEEREDDGFAEEQERRPPRARARERAHADA